MSDLRLYPFLSPVFSLRVYIFDFCFLFFLSLNIFPGDQIQICIFRFFISSKIVIFCHHPIHGPHFSAVSGRPGGAGVGHLWCRYGNSVSTCATKARRYPFRGAGSSGKTTPAPYDSSTCAARMGLDLRPEGVDC